MSGSRTNKGGGIIVTQDFDEIHFTNDDLAIMRDRDTDQSQFFSLDLNGRFQDYSEIDFAFSEKYPGVRPEAFTGIQDPLNDTPLYRDVRVVNAALEANVGSYCKTAYDGQEPTTDR